MKVYLAPMEGITGYTYRNIYRRHFADADRYFTPFISTHEKLGGRVKREILPENNKGMELIPQIMVANSDEAVQLEKLITPYGYEELNINAGCPSGTVVNKGRGSGMLRDPDTLDRTLDEIFGRCSCRISVKTRLGWENTGEWEMLARIYGRYPFTEVIVHSRVREEYYSGCAHMEAMEIAHELISAPICYNGDIFTVQDAQTLLQKYPWLDRVMVGRGVLRDPYLIEDLQNTGCTRDPQKIREFMDDMLETYLVLFESEINTLYHLKEIWSHLGSSYPDKEKELKTIRKTRSITEYKAAVGRILG